MKNEHLLNALHCRVQTMRSYEYKFHKNHINSKFTRIFVYKFLKV